MLRIWLLFLLQMLLKLYHAQAIEASDHVTMLQSAAVKAWTVRVVALANDLPAANNDGAMTEVERRFVGLLEAQRQIGIGTERHFKILEKLIKLVVEEVIVLFGNFGRAVYELLI